MKANTVKRDKYMIFFPDDRTEVKSYYSPKQALAHAILIWWQYRPNDIRNERLKTSVIITLECSSEHLIDELPLVLTRQALPYVRRITKDNELAEAYYYDHSYY